MSYIGTYAFGNRYDNNAEHNLGEKYEYEYLEKWDSWPSFHLILNSDSWDENTLANDSINMEGSPFYKLNVEGYTEYRGEQSSLILINSEGKE